MAQLRYGFVMRKRGDAAMHVSSRNSSLLILAITALTCSRSVFALFHDPEGPNILVVTVLAALIYLISAAAYLSNAWPSLAGLRRTLAAVFIQIGVAAFLYLALR
jgi:hypothetical protein